MSSYSLNIFLEIPSLSSKLTMFWHNFFAHKTLGGQSINSCVPNFIKKWTHLCSYFSNKKILFIFIIYFSISCSTTKVFYNYADLLLLNWIESYLELSKKQSSDLNIKIENFFIWHRKSELPKIVIFLQELKTRYGNGIDKQDIYWIRSESKIIWKRTLYYAEKDIVSLLLTITDSQVLQTKEKLANKEDDWLLEQSIMSSDELRDYILGRTYKFVEEFLGPLEPIQKQQIKEWIEPDPNWVAMRLRNREKFQDYLVELLKSKETLNKNIHSWVSYPESHWTDDFKSVIEVKRQEWEAIIIMIDMISLPRQRKHFLDKIDEYIEDFNELADIS